MFSVMCQSVCSQGAKRDHCGLVYTCWLGRACGWSSTERLSCVSTHVVPSSVYTAPVKYQKGGAIRFPIFSTNKILLIVNRESFYCLIYLMCQWHIVFIKGSVCPDWKAVVSYCPTWGEAWWRTSGRIPYPFTVKKLPGYFTGMKYAFSHLVSLLSFSINWSTSTSYRIHSVALLLHAVWTVLKP